MKLNFGRNCIYSRKRKEEKKGWLVGWLSGALTASSFIRVVLWTIHMAIAFQLPRHANTIVALPLELIAGCMHTHRHSMSTRLLPAPNKFTTPFFQSVSNNHIIHYICKTVMKNQTLFIK